MTALAVLLAGSSAAGEPSAAGVQLVVGDNGHEKAYSRPQQTDGQQSR